MTEEILKSLDVAISDKRTSIATLKLELLQLVRSRDNLTRKIKHRKTGRPKMTGKKDYTVVRKEDILSIISDTDNSGIYLNDIVEKYKDKYGVSPVKMNVSARLSSLKRDNLIKNTENGLWYCC